MGFVEVYREKHQHPINRALHSVGIPLIVISLPLFFWDWRWALGLFTFGWILQFIGHLFEGKAPAFFSNPIHLITGVVWWVRKALGLESKDEGDNQ